MKVLLIQSGDYDCRCALDAFLVPDDWDNSKEYRLFKEAGLKSGVLRSLRDTQASYKHYLAHLREMFGSVEVEEMEMP